MSTATLSRRKTPDAGAPYLYQESDLASLPEYLSGVRVKYELIHGELITTAPPGDIHGFRQAGILYFLYGEQLKGRGEVRGEVAVVLGRDPDSILGPDAAFILKESLPVQRSKEGYLETIPEIVVEVRSKNDTKKEIQVKVELYLDAGVKEIWLLDPVAKTVAVNQADGNVRMFRGDDTLTCDLLPGFAAPLAKLFEGE
jgi:Uma2 family endonuclease